MSGMDRTLLTQAYRKIGRGLLLAGALTFFVNILMLVVPLYTMQVYDRVMSSRSLETLTMLAVISVGGLVLYGVLDFIRARAFLVCGAVIAHRFNVPALQAAIVDALGGGTRNAGQTMRDLNDLRNFMTSNAVVVPLDLLWTPIFLVILFILHPIYGWIAVGSALLLLTMNALTDALTRRPIAEANEASAKVFADVASTVRHAEAIEAMGMLPPLARRWQMAQIGSASLIDRGVVLSRGMASASRSLRLILQIATISAGAALVIRNEASPGSMIATGIIMARLLQPFEHLVENWRQWIVAQTAHKRIRELLNGDGTRRSTMPLPRPDGRLTVDRVSHVPKGLQRPVLRGVSFALEPGEVLGIIGPSGAGKSTLSRLLVGIWEPTAGGIYLDGTSTFLWERESFGRYVGYVPQSVALLDGTIGENISRMAQADPAEIVRAARLAGVHDMIGRLPFGYDTPVGENAFALSGGQRQRIALARALFGKPRLIVLDEPNSNLDHEGEQALLNAINHARRDGATIVMVAHRPSIVSVADKLLVLKDGMVEHFGERTDVLKMVQPGGAVKVARLVRTGESA
ncbi:type I secretion system permease/ATPase (plasmid) [Azospirillum sp. TSH58]|uniref:type I secretion system permease/ATPase n=1 Tax=Azospirillum sp. TSH58 TaxID=664962 RepID=UPI000D60241B|nr:type I secretion system permease/ATPase [Azospirillum sp. TSH58]AWJ82041.1 type I secretion system permease/ATPase [Azospirillum sp. TSH58]